MTRSKGTEKREGAETPLWLFGCLLFPLAFEASTFAVCSSRSSSWLRRLRSSRFAPPFAVVSNSAAAPRHQQQAHPDCPSMPRPVESASKFRRQSARRASKSLAMISPMADEPTRHLVDLPSLRLPECRSMYD